MRHILLLIPLALLGCVEPGEPTQAQIELDAIRTACQSGDTQACIYLQQRRAQIAQAYSRVGAGMAATTPTFHPIAPRYPLTGPTTTNCVRNVTGMNCTTY